MFSLPLGCMKSLFPKLFVTIFCFGGISPGENGYTQFWKEKFRAIMMDPDFFFLSAWVERDLGSKVL
jgi:hypothetical protein